VITDTGDFTVGTFNAGGGTVNFTNTGNVTGLTFATLEHHHGRDAHTDGGDAGPRGR